MPARLPRQIKEQRGTLRPCREKTNAPSPPLGAPDMPKHLTKGGKKAWAELCEALAKLGTLASTDTAAIESAAETWAEAREARAAIEKDGRFYTSPTRDGGTMIRPHPALASMQDADKRLRAWLVEFGLTPASRNKAAATAPATNIDPLAGLMN